MKKFARAMTLLALMAGSFQTSNAITLPKIDLDSLKSQEQVEAFLNRLASAFRFLSPTTRTNALKRQLKRADINWQQFVETNDMAAAIRAVANMLASGALTIADAPAAK